MHSPELSFVIPTYRLRDVSDTMRHADAPDIIGAGIAVVGMAVIMYRPR